MYANDITKFLYSKTCLKRPFRKKTKLGFKIDDCLMQDKSIAKEHSAILSTFKELPFVFETFVLNISRRLRWFSVEQPGMSQTDTITQVVWPLWWTTWNGKPWSQEEPRTSWSCSSKLYMALWTYLQTSTGHLHLHSLTLVTLLNTDKFSLLVTTTNTASSLKQFVSGIPFQPQWLRLRVWYLSNRSSLRYHSKQCRPGQM